MNSESRFVFRRENVPKMVAALLACPRFVERTSEAALKEKTNDPTGLFLHSVTTSASALTEDMIQRIQSSER